MFFPRQNQCKCPFIFKISSYLCTNASRLPFTQVMESGESYVLELTGDKIVMTPDTLWITEVGRLCQRHHLSTVSLLET